MSNSSGFKNARRIEIAEDTMGMRLDRALAQTLEHWSRSGVGELIRQGAVYVNGSVAKKGTAVIRKDDVVELDNEKATKLKENRMFARDAEEFTATGKVSAVVPEDIPLDIVYEDDDVLVVDKPAGMVVHPAYANTSGTLANAIAGYFVKKGIPLFRRIGLVHRLDKDVSGLLLVAKHDDALRILSEQFSSVGITSSEADLSRKAVKKYWAVVGPVSDTIMRKRGLLDADREIKVEGYIGRSRKDRKIHTFSKHRSLQGPGKVSQRYALSYMRVKENLGKGRYLLEVRIVTGRTHQIRSQLAWMGIPIAGDERYGGEKRYKEGIALRCVSLGFIPPGVYLGEENLPRYTPKYEDRHNKRGNSAEKTGRIVKKDLDSGISEEFRTVVEKYEAP